MCRETAFSDVRKNMLILLCFVLGLAANCTTLPSQQTAEENMREYVHKNGLMVKLPEKYSAEESGEGFVVQPADGSNKNLRYPIEANVAFHKNGKMPKGEWTQQKNIGNRTIKYRIEKQEGGSGGAEYSFSAYESAGNGYIYYEQREQNEDVQPQFNICWTIIENTFLKN